MGAGSLINTGNQNPYTSAAKHEPQSLMEVTGSAVNAYLKNYNSVSGYFLERDQINQQYDSFKKITGQPLEDIIGRDFYNSKERWRKTDEYILEQRNVQQNALWNNVKTTEEMREAARQEAREARVELEEKKEVTAKSIGIAGEIIGGIGASMTDPAIIASGVAGGVLARGQTVLRTMAIEGVVAGGTEAALQPIIADWQKQTGAEYTLGDALANVALGAVAGAGIAGITSSNLKGAINATRNKGSVLMQVAAESPKTPRYAKVALEQMADYVSLKEASPFLDKSPRTDAVHAKNAKAIEDAFNARKKASEAEIDVASGKVVDSAVGKASPDIEPDFVKPETEMSVRDLRNAPSRVIDDKDLDAIIAEEGRLFDEISQGQLDKLDTVDDLELNVQDVQDRVSSNQKILDAIKVCSI
jgi:hypothetical protein